jgi:hypothetical protein
MGSCTEIGDMRSVIMGANGFYDPHLKWTAFSEGLLWAGLWTLRFKRGWGFLNQLRYYQLFKKCSTLWSYRLFSKHYVGFPPQEDSRHPYRSGYTMVFLLLIRIEGILCCLRAIILCSLGACITRALHGIIMQAYKPKPLQPEGWYCTWSQLLRGKSPRQLSVNCPKSVIVLSECTGARIGGHNNWNAYSQWSTYVCKAVFYSYMFIFCIPHRPYC